MPCHLVALKWEVQLLGSQKVSCIPYTTERVNVFKMTVQGGKSPAGL